MKIDPTTWKSNSSGFLGNECTAFAPDGDIQKAVNENIIKLARELKAPLLMTLDSHFVRPETKKVQDVLLQGSNKDGWMFSTVYSQLNTEEAWQKWKQQHGICPETVDQFVEAVENNQRLVDMVEPIVIEKKYRLPEIELPADIASNTTVQLDQKLLDYTQRLVEKYSRLPVDNPVYIERLQRELRVIANNGKINFLPYFIFLATDVCEFADRNGIVRGVGRGSAPGCLLSYLLRITHLDPIKYNLSFERFLSVGRINRGKFPDIDMDFGNVTPVIDFLKQKYGDKFIRICTTGTMKVKDAIRNVGRVMMNTRTDKNNAEIIDAVAKSIGEAPMGVDLKKWLYEGTEDAGGVNPPHIETNETLRMFLEDHPDFKEIMDGVLNTPKSIGRHACAYCLSDIPVSEIVPMCEVGKGDDKELCTQFTMGPVEELGLIKFDLLGVNTLNDIQLCIDLIKKRHGVELDMYTIDTESPQVFDEFCLGNNETVFQFGGDIPVKLCRQIKPRTLQDLSDITAAGRPGTMYSLMPDGETTLIEAWTRRRSKKEIPSYVHPDVQEILSQTLGICLAGSTLVYRPRSGTCKPISAMKEGDVVCGVDAEYNIVEAVVTHHVCNGEKDVLTITLDNKKSITATSDHQFLTETGWKKVKDLLPHDRLACPFAESARDFATRLAQATGDKNLKLNWQKISSITPQGKELVYDITVDKIHNFVANGIIAHNCLYQEQIMRMFVKCCGYTEEQSDEIREIIGKKKADKMAEIIPDIQSRLQAAGWNANQIDSFISLCVASSSYSFNASHSLAYSHIAYTCQYLKTLYPIEWWCAVLQNSSKGDMSEIAGACHKYVLPPDINKSDVDFYIIDANTSKIVYPLRMVHGVKGAAEIICAPGMRPFKDIEDFYARVDRRRVHKGVISNLIWSGAFDELHGVECEMDRNEVYRRYVVARGESPDRFQELSLLKVLAARNESLDFGSSDYSVFCNEHFSGTINLSQVFGKKIFGVGAVAGFSKGTRLAVCGIIESSKGIITKKGDPMAFVAVKNGVSLVDITVFPKLYEGKKGILKEGNVAVFVGKVDEYGGRNTFIADDIYLAVEE